MTRNTITVWTTTALIGGCTLLAGASPRQEAAAAPTAFDRIKALVGDWQADLDDDGTVDSRVEYRVTSAGSAVMERLFPGTPHEMITMYHRHGEDVIMTHYCAMGNQPRLKLKPAMEGDPADVLRFEFLDGTNMDASKDAYMGALTLTIIGENEFNARWTSYEGPKAVDELASTWTRVPSE